MENITIQYVKCDALKPYQYNARTHSKKQLQQIANSIKEFGFTNPILVDHDHTIIAGHGRLIGAQMCGMTSVPCVQIEYLTPSQVRAYVIADNRLAELAGWDKGILAIELQHLSLEDDFDLSLTGFDMPEIDLLIQENNPAAEEFLAKDFVLSIFDRQSMKDFQMKYMLLVVMIIGLTSSALAYSGEQYVTCKFGSDGDDRVALMVEADPDSQQRMKLEQGTFLITFEPTAKGDWREVTVQEHIHDWSHTGPNGWVSNEQICEVRYR